MWDELAAALEPQRTVLRPDLPGFGETPYPEGPFSYAGWVAALLDEHGIDRLPVVGNSFGGRVALELAALGRATRLVLAAPGHPGHDWSEEMRRYGEAEDAAGTVEELVKVNLDMWVPARLHDRVRPMLERWAEQALAAEPDEEDGPEIDGIDVPTLIVTGEHDVSDFAAIAERLAGEIPGARVVELPGTGHLIPLERPEEFNRMTLDFVVQENRG